MQNFIKFVRMTAEEWRALNYKAPDDTIIITGEDGSEELRYLDQTIATTGFEPTLNETFLTATDETDELPNSINIGETATNGSKNLIQMDKAADLASFQAIPTSANTLLFSDDDGNLSFTNEIITNDGDLTFEVGTGSFVIGTDSGGAAFVIAGDQITNVAKETVFLLPTPSNQKVSDTGTFFETGGLPFEINTTVADTTITAANLIINAPVDLNESIEIDGSLTLNGEFTKNGSDPFTVNTETAEAKFVSDIFTVTNQSNSFELSLDSAGVAIETGDTTLNINTGSAQTTLLTDKLFVSVPATMKSYQFGSAGVSLISDGEDYTLNTGIGNASTTTQIHTLTAESIINNSDEFRVLGSDFDIHFNNVQGLIQTQDLPLILDVGTADATINADTLNINAAVDFIGDLTFTGDVDITGDLSVDGAITKTGVGNITLDTTAYTLEADSAFETVDDFRVMNTGASRSLILNTGGLQVVTGGTDFTVNTGIAATNITSNSMNVVTVGTVFQNEEFRSFNAISHNLQFTGSAGTLSTANLPLSISSGSEALTLTGVSIGTNGVLTQTGTFNLAGVFSMTGNNAFTVSNGSASSLFTTTDFRATSASFNIRGNASGVTIAATNLPVGISAGTNTLTLSGNTITSSGTQTHTGGYTLDGAFSQTGNNTFTVNNGSAATNFTTDDFNVTTANKEALFDVGTSGFAVVGTYLNCHNAANTRTYDFGSIGAIFQTLNQQFTVTTGTAHVTFTCNNYTITSSGTTTIATPTVNLNATINNLNGSAANFLQAPAFRAYGSTYNIDFNSGVCQILTNTGLIIDSASQETRVSTPNFTLPNITSSFGTSLVLNGGRVYRLTSSARNKEDISAYKEDSSKIYDLVAKNFTYIDSKHKAFGYIAEDVEELMPSIVTKNDEGATEGICYQLMVIPIIEEMKKLKAEITELRALLNT